ncbi:MAG: metallophosphoesterase [Actinobacteria bacterium]|nr:metallophosphoesterase [Actinomycetota bacterium]
MGVFRRRRRRWLSALIVVLALIVAVLAYGYAETYWIQVKEYTLADPDVPAAFDGTRIALLADIHHGQFLSQDRVASLVERVNALEPDLIVLGGDYVYGDIDYADSCFAELRHLRAPLGCFAVLGNHDYGDYKRAAGGPAPVIRAIDEAGITLLREDALWIESGGQRIRLGGVSDYQVDRPRIDPVLEGTSEDDLVLLISHNPDFAEELPADAVDLVLAGHTHGGQVTVLGLWAPYIPSEYGQKYRTGMVVTEKTTVIISNGIGTSTVPPIRLLARPEIVVITLENGTAGDATP